MSSVAIAHSTFTLMRFHVRSPQILNMVKPTTINGDQPGDQNPTHPSLKKKESDN